MTTFLHAQRSRSKRNIGIALLFFVLLITIGMIFYSTVEGWSLLDALYFSVITLTTVGYGDLHPTHDISQIFTMIYIFFGVGTVLFVFSTLSNHIAELHERKSFEDDVLDRLKRIESQLDA